MVEKIFLTRAETARYLSSLGIPISNRGLVHMASVGTGPAFTRRGRYCLYRREDVLKWAMETK